MKINKIGGEVIFHHRKRGARFGYPLFVSPPADASVAHARGSTQGGGDGGKDGDGDVQNFLPDSFVFHVL